MAQARRYRVCLHLIGHTEGAITGLQLAQNASNRDLQVRAF
jgi:hypothetical protein